MCKKESYIVSAAIVMVIAVMMIFPLAAPADTTPPTGDVAINAGAALTNSTSVTLTLNCIDSDGCAEMQLSSDNITWTAPEAFATTRAWILAPGDGNKAVFARFKDAAGNWTEAYPAFDAHIRPNTIMLDTTAPTGSVVIDSGADLTNTTSVLLSLSASDKNGVSEMQFSNDGASWSAPMAYAANASWTLSSGNGAKTVYAKFKDWAGNWGSASSGTITLDAAAPVISTTALPSGVAGVLYSQGLAASAGVTPYTWSVQSGNLPPGLSLGSDTGAITGTPTASGRYSFTVQITDANSVSNVKKLSVVVKNSDDKLYVVRETPTGAREVAEFLPDGTFVKSYGSSDMASVDGRAHMAISGDSLFVAENGTSGSLVLQFDSTGTFVRAITPDSSSTPGVNSITEDFENQSFYFIDGWGGSNVVRHIDDLSTGQSSPLGVVAETVHDMVTDPASAVLFAMGYGSPYIVDNTAEDGHYDRVYMMDALGNVLGAFDSAVFDKEYLFDAGSLAIHPLTGNLFVTTMSPIRVAPDFGEAGGTQDTIVEFERGTGLVVNSITPQPGAYIDQIAFDSGGDLYVNYYNFSAPLHNVYVYRTDGSLLRTIPAGGKVYDVLVTPVIPATSIRTYTIAASAGQNGSITPSGPLSVNKGSNASFTISPAAGYKVADVQVDGESAGPAKGYNFFNVQSDHTISATFTADTFNIEAMAYAGGSITPSGTITLNRGESRSYTIIPDEGWIIKDIVVDGVSKGAVMSYTVSNVTSNHTITARFMVITYAITASAAANGGISPFGSVLVPINTSKTFTITPASGYHVADVLVDGVTAGAVTSYTFTNLTAAHTISASFAANPSYTITASAGSNGSISPSGIVSVTGGTNKTFTMTPTPGYRVQSVLVDGASVGSSSIYNFFNITADHTISVSFELDVYTISAIAYAGGSITPAGDTVVAKGGIQAYTITPDPGYVVKYVVLDTSTNLGAVTSYTVTNVKTNRTIKAYFKVAP